MESFANYLRYGEKQSYDRTPGQLISFPAMYQARVILLDRRYGHQPRISNLLLMQSVTLRPLRLRTANQSGFHHCTIRIQDLNHALPVARPFCLDAHYNFALLVNLSKYLQFWNIFWILFVMIGRHHLSIPT